MSNLHCKLSLPNYTIGAILSNGAISFLFFLGVVVFSYLVSLFYFILLLFYLFIYFTCFVFFFVFFFVCLFPFFLFCFLFVSLFFFFFFLSFQSETVSYIFSSVYNINYCGIYVIIYCIIDFCYLIEELENSDNIQLILL